MAYLEGTYDQSKVGPRAAKSDPRAVHKQLRAAPYRGRWVTRPAGLRPKSLKMSVFMAWIFFMLFIVSLALVTIILAIFGLFFEEAIVIAVACLTTTGPIIAVLGLDPSLISDLSLFPKIVLVISMVLGRLEILVALSVIISVLKRA